MKIHPLPRKRNITIQYEMNPRTTRSQAETLLTGGSHKKLRRLPHIFSRVLELPFRSDADVEVEESPDCFKFVAETDGRIGDVVRAHMVEIHPGVTKIVIRSNSLVGFSSLDHLELDMWRFRLPETTRPELASAVYEDGELIVTVPKGGEVENLELGGGGGEGNGQFRGGMGNGNNNNNNRLGSCRSKVQFSQVPKPLRWGGEELRMRFDQGPGCGVTKGRFLHKYSENVASPQDILKHHPLRPPIF
ncbi:hypothetical protein CRYUN_Cryun36dG0056900 [Craigia yunnanensis]